MFLSGLKVFSRKSLYKETNAYTVKIADNGLNSYFSFLILFFSFFSFLFLFLEQLRLGVISHAVTSVTT